MKNFKTAIAAVIALSATVASADLIYWQINDAIGNQYAGDNAYKTINFAYATVKAGGADSSPLYLSNDDGSDSQYWKLYAAGGMDDSTGATYSGTFDSGVSSFLFELWDSENNRVGWQSFAASALASSIWSGSGTPSTSGGTPFVVSQVVPEPTSGLLLLVGLAGLALRRRRRA